MAARKKLTVAGINKLRPPASGRLEVLDSVIPQLALRVTPNGTKSFTLRTRVNGDQVRITLGEFPVISLAEAREQASEAIRLAKRGISPNEVKRQEREEADRQRANTVAAIAYEFVDRYAKRNQKTWVETQRKLEMHILPVWGSRPINEITRRDVISLLDDIEDARTAITANRIRKLLRQLFQWAVERDIIDTTPVVGRNAIVREVPRDRYLSEDEIRAVWNVCDDLSYPFGPLIRLLIVTGQRRGEVAGMRWSEIKDDNWTIPRERNKSNREHVLPLSKLAREILSSVPKIDDQDLVYSTTGTTPVSGFGRIKGRLDEGSGVSNWRLHDLRATVATLMEVKLRIAPYIISGVLNHSPASVRGITSVYSRADALDDRRDALEAWGSYLEQLVGDSSRDAIIQLRDRQPSQLLEEHG